MKTLFRILVVVVCSLFVHGCSISTETQMKRKLRLTGFYNNDITKIDVTDTIFLTEVDSALKADTIRLNFLKERVKEFEQTVDSIRKTPRPEHPDPIKTKYIREVFDTLMTYNRLVDVMNERELLYQRMNRNYYDNYLIRGYRVTIHFEDGKTNEVILDNDYSFVCSSFMFDPLDSVLRFRPRQHRRMPPHELMINDNKHGITRQRFGK